MERLIAVPAAAAARAIAGSPSGSARCWKATGATAMGIESGAPSTSASVVTSDDVHEDARAQLPLPERLAVAAQRALVAGPAREVAVGARLQPVRGEPLEIVDVERLGHRARTLPPRPVGSGADERRRARARPT